MNIRRSLICMGCLLLGLPTLAQHEPMLAAVDPADSTVNLYRVNGAQLQLLKSIPIPKAVKGLPSQMCLDPMGSTLFVGVPAKNGVIAIDLSSQTVPGTFSDDNMKAPDGCVVSPDAEKLYVADREADTVFVFATVSRKLLKKISVAKEPRRALFLPDGTLLVTSGEGESLNVINPASDTLARTVKAGIDPRAMALTPDGKLLVITNVSGDVLAWYRPDTLELVADYGTGKSPQALLMRADGKAVYALSVADRLIAVAGINDKHAGRLVDKIPVSQGMPIAMTGPSNAQYLFLSLTDGTLVVADPASKIVTPIPSAKGGGALIYRP